MFSETFRKSPEILCQQGIQESILSGTSGAPNNLRKPFRKNITDSILWCPFVRKEKPRNSLSLQGFWVVTPAGLEPATTGLEIQCSIQLSYGA